MIIYIGADHRGFALKEKLEAFLKEEAYEVVDVGAQEYNKDDDYPLFAVQVAQHVANAPDRSRGIVLCGSGAGVDIAANKIDGIRAVLGSSPDQVYASRHDDDVNVLAIAADFTDEDNAKKMVSVFLATSFGKTERALRRLKEIDDIESQSQQQNT